jgi:ribosomal protein S18 acetylase RimI-like enzyme
MPAKSIRPAGPGDYQAVAALNREVQRFHADHYPDLFKPPSEATLPQAAYESWLAAPDGFLVVAVESDGVVGYAWARVIRRDETPYRMAHRVVYVDQICVAGAARGRRHGRRLMAAIREHAASQAIRRIELDTWAANLDARGFFEAEGFHEFNVRLADNG